MAAFAFQYRDCYDAIVLSGDLATTGAADDLSAVIQFMEGVPVHGDYQTAEGQPTLLAARKPILIIPGNHDRFGAALAMYPPGAVVFDHILGAYWNAGQGAQELWTCRKAESTLVILGADLTLRPGEIGEGPWGYLAQGRAYRDTLTRLRDITESARRRDPLAIVVWVIHFDPTVEDGAHALLDSHHFREAVEQQQVPTVLCGHVHYNYSTPFATANLYVCGTTTQHYAPWGNRLNLIEIDVSEASNSATIQSIPFWFDAVRDKQFVPSS